jgi:hypothetical protein
VWRVKNEHWSSMKSLGKRLNHLQILVQVLPLSRLSGFRHTEPYLIVGSLRVRAPFNSRGALFDNLQFEIKCH